MNFKEMRNKVIATSANNKDATVAIGELVEGYAGNSSFLIEEGEFTLTKTGFKQLGNHIGFPSEAIAKLDSDPGLQASVLRHVVADDPDKQVNLRITKNKITHIIGSDYFLVKNIDVVFMMEDLIKDGLLPPHKDTSIGAFYISPDGREFSARLLCPEWWNYDVGTNGRDTIHGAMFIKNSEHGQGAFLCGAAIARIACFNWTLGKFDMRLDHRFKGEDDFYDALSATSKLIDSYSGDMVGQLRDARGQRLQRPELVFEKAAQRLGIPAWAMDTGRKYFETETDADNVFDVVQAVTRASQVISSPGSRRKPKWGLRETVESGILDLVKEIGEDGEERFVMTVGDVISELETFDPETEAVGFSPVATERAGREVIISA